MDILNLLSWRVTGGTEEKHEHLQPGRLVPIRDSNLLGEPTECLLVFSSVSLLLLLKDLKIKHETIILPVVPYGCLMTG
jgi:hypothetical protein